MIQALSDALAERGYDTLTEVQTAVTDPELAGRDLLVSAQTGSGKTVGFGLAMAADVLGGEERLGRADTPLALVVAPTRELALQVQRELVWLYERTGARVVSCVGGMDARDERRALERGAHIVVGTPGRLRDHIQRGNLDLSQLKAAVLDEADEMLDLGFREDLEFMLGEAPETRRTLLFSATVPPMIERLATEFQRDGARVTTKGSGKQHADISFQALRVADADAEKAIVNVLRYHEAQNAIVFANTRASVARLSARFTNRGFPVVTLSGELSQDERSHALQAMRDGRARVCVATDVAARGIDLPGLELVIHAELPINTEAMLHRSGRTGRAGKKGVSAFIITGKVAKKAQRLFKWAKINPEWTVPPSAEEVRARDEERLLADPVWSEPLNDEETAFAAKLLESHDAQTIAAAYLRLHRTRHSAPEELSPPDAPAPKQKRDFGPSRWVSLSVGEDQKASARWLLPLICRSGGLTKTDIGAIRVKGDQTFAELAELALPKFLDNLGTGMELEDGITVKVLDKAPDLPAPAPRPGGKPFRKPHRKGDGPAPRGKPRGDGAPAKKRPAKPGAKPFKGKDGAPRKARRPQ